MYLLLMIEMFSPVIVIISLFKVVARFGLLDSYIALIVLDALFTVAFNTWMMNGYFKTIPKDIEEAAMIDGCTRVQTMTRIMLPIAVPGLVTVMIYAFIFAWNEYAFAVLLTSGDAQTAPPFIPIIIGDDMATFGAWRKLIDKGVFVNAVIAPGVPQGQQLLRVSLIATFKQEHVDKIVNTIGEVGKELGLIA